MLILLSKLNLIQLFKVFDLHKYLTVKILKLHNSKKNLECYSAKLKNWESLVTLIH